MIELMDVPLNWSQVMDVYTSKPPPMAFISKRGIEARDSRHSVLLRNDSDLRAVRDWLYERGCSFRLFGRYAIEVADYEIRRYASGLHFVFTNDDECCLFKLFWAT